MNHVPDWLRSLLPPLGYQRDVTEPTVYAHYAAPSAPWHFYPSEGQHDGSEYVLFGLVVPSVPSEWDWRHVPESVLELMVQTGTPVELDEKFTPGPFTVVVPCPED